MELAPVTYIQPPDITFSRKPAGLWVSVDGEQDWKEWCESEKFSVDKLTIRHRVVLRDKAPILTLASAQEILEFQDTYGKPDILNELIQSKYMAIDWPRVATEYAGIIIAPYQWCLRMDLMWYYSWDCASGCIWDISAIERIEVAA
jgi:hypothetical protein